MRIFHLALASEWAEAQQRGSYTTSTIGRSLAEEGFIHASRGDQWQGVRERYYADVDEPLVLLVIDPERLTAPLVVEEVPGTGDSYPHIYGALNVDAVVSTIPLEAKVPDEVAPVAPTTVPASPPNPTAPSESFSALFFAELFFRLSVALLVLGLTAGGTLLGLATDTEWGPIIGAAVGFVIGFAAARMLLRRRDVRWVTASGRTGAAARD